jgi:hypothetical protein
MNRRKVVTFLAALACGTAASQAHAGTKLVSSFREPSAGPLKFKKVLVLVIAPHESQMQFGEAVLTNLMKRTHGISAHAVMTGADARDEQKMRAYMEKEAFDGAVTMRLLAAGQETTSQWGVNASSYTGFWSYYSYAWPLVTDIGYVHTERLFHMETQVYSVKDDKLVWGAITKTTNPKDARQLVEQVAKTVGDALRKQQLVE